MIYNLLLTLCIGLYACSLDSPGQATGQDSQPPQGQGGLINPEGMSLQERIKTPVGYERQPYGKDSYAAYLRGLKMKEHGYKVRYFDGRLKAKDWVYAAVVDIDVGTRDLQQCADAVMRLRGEYLWHSGQKDKIHFSFTNGFRVDYKKYRQGYRVAVDGNKTWWVKKTGASDTYSDFRRYMDLIFIYAGSLSLSKELKPKDISRIAPGDVFIQGGSPGHAVLVVDVARHKETGKTIFLLAQSYMPAQDIHVLVNPVDKKLSPWYSIDFGEGLKTPEWTFRRGDLKCFD